MAFTSDPETSFLDVIHISGVYGILDKNYQKELNPDEFIVYKPNISQGTNSIIKKKMGLKNQMLTFNKKSELHPSDTPKPLRNQFILMDDEILKIAEWGLILEDYYGTPISFEWAKDGITEDLYLLQARPQNIKKFKN
jgi:pyruvate,water dikinase